MPVESQKTVCNTMYEQAKEDGRENYNVVLNVLDNVDKSRTLLTILNGSVVYDSVND